MYRLPCTLVLCVLLAAPSLGNGLPESVRWLQDYLQIDTTNPPGNELAAAEFLAALLTAEGLEPQLLTSPEGRTSLYLRHRAPKSQGRAVVLTHHLDVVAAGTPWRVPPFSGRPLEGRLWGRGALDVKSLGIAQLAAMVSLIRDGAALDRDVIYLAVADEEAGGDQGTRWLLEEHPELFAGVEAVLGEGGSNRVVNDRLVWWGVEVTQKRPLWLKVTARGRGGHASGFHPASATHQLVAGLQRLLERPLRYRVTEAARIYLGAVARLEGGHSLEMFKHLEDIVRPEGFTEPMGAGLEIYFIDSLQVTELDNGKGSNVVAPEASAHLDIRLLPDSDQEAFLADVRERLGPRLEVEVLLTAPQAPASPTDHRIFRALEHTLGVRGPVVPNFMSGTTDSRFFRQRGIPAYGFSPFALDADESRGIHALDESIPRREFLRGVETMRRVLLAIAREN